MKGGHRAPYTSPLPTDLEQHPNTLTNRPAQVLRACWPYHHRPLRAQHRCSAGVGLPGMARAPDTEGARWSRKTHPPDVLHLGLGMEEAVLRD